MLLQLLIAALTCQGLPKEFLDRKVRDGKEQTGTALDELTMGQLLRLTTMPSARLSQMQCTGYGIWLRRNGVPALASERLDALHGALADDAAKFGEMTFDVGLAFVAIYAEEAEEKKKAASAQEFAAWRQLEDRRCRTFFAAAGNGSLKLVPIAPASVIDPRLNGCHAAYRAAAGRARGREGLALARQAERAAKLALNGKSGTALAAARAALDAEATAAAGAPVLDAEAEMIQLTLCVPRLKVQGTE